MTFISRILEMDLHTLEEAEQDALLDLLRAGHSLITRRPPKDGHDSVTITPKPISTTLKKETTTLMAVNQATDDQVFTQVFSLADADQVPVDGSASPVTVTVVDSTGADVSKWINVAQDTENPLKFVYSRKTDDGTQPQDLAFTSIGTATVNGAPSEFRQDMMFTPGAATSLTATITTGAAMPVSSGSSPAEQPPVLQEQIP